MEIRDMLMFDKNGKPKTIGGSGCKKSKEILSEINKAAIRAARMATYGINPYDELFDEDRK